MQKKSLYRIGAMVALLAASFGVISAQDRVTVRWFVGASAPINSAIDMNRLSCRKSGAAGW